ncbi:hypothetical protein CSKR_104345 [Clonorchis sinensis]|uniref:Uncharacterized protein n=1 Tax=Clonorchis sinensis TaxID=79923 RepID=A0A3R7JZ17_CLOSI|nr:hypothetical protein CSKR_104345 [Clonorchis sinensis]
MPKNAVCRMFQDGDVSNNLVYFRKWWKSFQTIRLINCPEQSGEENISEYFVFKITGQLEEATPYYDRKFAYQFRFDGRLIWNQAESLVYDVFRQLNVVHQAASCFSWHDIRDIAKQKHHKRKIQLGSRQVFRQHQIDMQMNVLVEICPIGGSSRI